MFLLLCLVSGPSFLLPFCLVWEKSESGKTDSILTNTGNWAEELTPTFGMFSMVTY